MSATPRPARSQRFMRPSGRAPSPPATPRAGWGAVGPTSRACARSSGTLGRRSKRGPSPFRTRSKGRGRDGGPRWVRRSSASGLPLVCLCLRTGELCPLERDCTGALWSVAGGGVRGDPGRQEAQPVLVEVALRSPWPNGTSKAFRARQSRSLCRCDEHWLGCCSARSFWLGVRQALPRPRSRRGSSTPRAFGPVRTAAPKSFRGLSGSRAIRFCSPSHVESAIVGRSACTGALSARSCTAASGSASTPATTTDPPIFWAQKCPDVPKVGGIAAEL